MEFEGEMPGPRVALFVTLPRDMFRPSVGFASVKLLEDAGCVGGGCPTRRPAAGQPAWNSGDRETAKALARQVIAAFEGYDYVVAPSGSCGATIAKDYASMFDAGDPWAERARALGARTHEITSFLTDVLGVGSVDQAAPVVATYHDSCSGLRSLKVREQPRRLLASVEGLELREMVESDVCCGFGGTFCVKYPEISNAMVADKTRHAAETGAELLLAGRSRLPDEHGRQGQPRGARVPRAPRVRGAGGRPGTPAIGETK
jgi:L-lactate dehydrogenase complex protein LldE